MDTLRQKLRPLRRNQKFISMPATLDVKSYPGKDLTQEEQNQEDDKNRREAMRDLIESWMDRLQLISVITTFFASTEASMITITAPSSSGTPLSIASQFANVGIMGALVVHSNAAIISFLGAFFLIRYKLKIADNEEMKVEGNVLKDKEFVTSPTSILSNGVEHIERLGAPRSKKSEVEHQTDPIPGIIRITSRSNPGRLVFSANPHLVQVGPFQGQPPIHLLSRCHALCITLTALGFALALMGILCFAWDRLPLSVSISSSFFMALCLLAGVYIMFEPEPEEGTSPHIYYTG